MPGMYPEGEYDLAGFAVGAVERAKIINGRSIVQPGDVVLGLASNGVHSNGYSPRAQVHRTRQPDFDADIRQRPNPACKPSSRPPAFT